MKKFNSFLFTVCLFILASCSIFGDNHHLLNVANSQIKIIGKWKWIQTSGGYFGDTLLTVDSPGVSETYLIFYPNHLFSVFSEDTLKEKGEYFFTTKNTNRIINFKNAKYYNTALSKQLPGRSLGSKYWPFFYSDGAFLQLHPLCVDCYSNLYKRVK